ncbi:MAG: phosphatase PAP2 family protein [Candidatus Woesearchaeota archaeon]
MKRKSATKSITPSQRSGILILVLLGILALSFFIDSLVYDWSRTIQHPIATIFFTALTWLGETEIYAVIAILLTLIFLVTKKRVQEYWYGLVASTLIVYALKAITDRLRPFLLYHTQSIVSVSSSAFPSGHSAVAFFTLPFLIKRYPRLKGLWWTLAILVAFSRIYLGVHFLSDVIAGAIIGFSIGSIFVIVEDKRSKRYHAIDWFEIRRKFFHVFLGLGILVLVRFNILTWWMSALITLTGIFIAIISTKKHIPFISQSLEVFERKEHLKTFPGRGIIVIFLSTTILLAFFDKKIVMAALMIWTLGDALSVLIGKHYGKKTHPFNTARMIEGTIAGIIAATIGAMFFVGWPIAFAAAAISLALESLELKIFGVRVEDNLLVPIVAAGVIVLLSTI